MLKRIPASVLKMLSHHWPHRNATYAEPLIDYNSFNIIRDDYPHPSRGKRFSVAHDEARSLVDDGVLMDISDKNDTSIVIDHQEQASLNFFCAQVYAAWSEHQARVKRWRMLRAQAEHRKRWADKQDQLIERQKSILDRNTQPH